MKTPLILLALVATPFAAAASVVMPLAPELSAPLVVPETPNEAVPETQEAPSDEDGAPLTPDSDPKTNPQTDQDLMLFPPLLEAGEGTMTAPSDGPLDAGRL
jgi:hypothetical protein